MQHSKSTHKQKQGFSLIELLVVMAIIAILMGLVVGVSGAVMRKAAVSRARAEISDLMNELEIYRTDKGSYPPQGSTATDWSAFFNWYENEKYVGTIYTITDKSGNSPIDPWGRAYEYQYNAATNPFIYLIKSKGPDNSLSIDDISNRNGAL